MVLYHGTNNWNQILRSRVLGLTEKERVEMLLRSNKISEENRLICQKGLSIYNKKPIFGNRVSIFFTSDFNRAVKYGKIVIAVNFPKIKKRVMDYVHLRKIDIKNVEYYCIAYNTPKQYIDRRKKEYIDDQIECTLCANTK